MSLYNAIGDPHQQGNQGWSYPGGCNQTSGAFTNSASSGREQSSGSTVIQQQSHILSSLLSAPSTSDRYVQLSLQETQVTQKEEDSMLLDEPGMVIGGEEVILTDNSPVTGRYHPSVSQSQQQALPYSSYIHKAGHAQYHSQGSAHMSGQQEFGAQQDLVNSHPSQPVLSYRQDSYSSSYPLQRMQPLYMQQQSMGQQQSHGMTQQQNHGQGQQGGMGPQTMSLPQQMQGQMQHSAMQPQTAKPVMVGQPQLQQPLTSHQLYLGGVQMNPAGHMPSMGMGQQPNLGPHHQQAEVNHAQTMVQQRGVGQHLLGQQQMASRQSLVSQQSSIQVSQGVQNPMHGQLRFMNMHGDAPPSSSTMTGSIQFISGSNALFIQQDQTPQQALLIQHVPQSMILHQTQPAQQNQFFQRQTFNNHQAVLRNTHNSVSMQNQVSLQNHQSRLPSQTLQTDYSIQSKPHSHIETGSTQSQYNTNAVFVAPYQGQMPGMDQQQQEACNQQQQVSVKQEQPEQAMLLQVHPNSTNSGNNYLSSHHSTQQILQHSPQKVITVSMGSPLTQHSLPNSPQVTSHMSSQVALNSSQQMGGQQQSSSQLSLQNSPQLSLKSSPQQFSVQGSPNKLQSSTSLLRLQTSYLSQSNMQLSLQNVGQVGHMATQAQNSHQNGSHLQVQSSHMQTVQNASVVQVQSVIPVQNTGHMLHLQNVPQTMQLAGNGSTQRPFPVSQQADGNNQQGAVPLVGPNADPAVTSTGRGGRGRARGRGSRGGRGGRGRGSHANSASGLQLASSHFRVSDAVYPPPPPPPPPAMEVSSSASVVDQALSASHTENAIQLCQDQGVQEVSMVAPKIEPVSGNSPLQGSLLSSLNNYSPPSSVSSSVPRLSATNEIWPTPMPCIRHEQSSDSPPVMVVDPLSTSSQQSSDCSVFSPSSFLDDIKPDPPVVATVPPSVPAVLAPEVVVPSTPTQPMVEVVKPMVLHLHDEQKPEPPKRKLAEDEEGTAVCKYCGYCSSNFEVCEGCKRKLPPDVKVVVKKRKLDNSEGGDERERTCGGGKVNSMPSGSSPSRKAMYSSKLQTQGVAFGTPHQGLSPDVLIGKGAAGQTLPITNRRGRGAGRGGYRNRKPKEPVLVTISSDEEEDPSSDASQRLSMSSSSASNHNSQEDEDGFFCTPVKPNSSFGTSRRNKMQDASGQSITQEEAAEGIFFKVRGVRIGRMRTSGQKVCFKTRTIYFKVKSDTTLEELEFSVYVTELSWIKFSFSPSQPVFFIKVTHECGCRLRSLLKMTPESREWFDPSSEDAQLGHIVVIVDSMLNEVGLRQMLQLYNQVQNLGDFLQELNSELANDLLVLSTPPVLVYPPGEMGLKAYQKVKASVANQSLLALKDKGDFVTGGEGLAESNGPLSVDGNQSNDGNETMNNSGRDSRSPSPRTGFVGPIEKLLSYPPPPAKGAITITNEDLFCLNEGEFLNDVILDFYLKYLYFEKLSEEDRKRTHIFSSFFFKRLTQRQSKSTQDDVEDKMTAQQRRHSRVKTWTRHVDIFSKDFLLIPINEKSHWFLAVVCFPAMIAQEHINYQPAASPYDEVGQSGDVAFTPPQPVKTLSEVGDDDSNSQDSMPDTTTPSSGCKGDHVLGKVISAEVAKKERISYNVGLRQACILIMDSLMGPSRNGIIRILKDYLQVEWDLKRGTERNMLKTVRGGCPKVPQQTNYSDCGVFVLQYAESFFETPILDKINLACKAENPIANFSIPMKLEKWFPLSKVDRKREEIRSLILRLQSEASR